MKRLWIVTELYYPEETSTGYYLTKLAEGLTDQFDVKVLCGQPNYFKRGVRAPSREVHNKVDIRRCWGTTLDKNVILFRLFNMLTLGMFVFFKALFNFKHNDIVLVVTTPPLMPFIIALASFLKGAKFVPLIHDNYPELAIAAKKLNPRSMAARLNTAFNKRLFANSAKIIVVGRDMKDLVATKLGKLDIPIAVIPNWAETDDLTPKSREENGLLKDLGLTDKFVLLSAGNMGYPNDIESMIQCADELRDDDRFHFLFLGTGAKRKWLENEAEARKLKNVTLLAPRPRKEQIDFLNACDIAMISLVPGMLGVSMPSRTYNTLAVGRPVLALAEAGSELELVVQEDNIGWVVPPNDPEKLLAAIFDAFEKKDDLKEMGERARNAALQKYTLQRALNCYHKELDSCV